MGSNSNGRQGYATEAYAASLTSIGQAVGLPRSGGWLLERPIPDSTMSDAIGPYPFFNCRDWSALAADLVERDSDWVSTCLVTDPFADVDAMKLQAAFPDRCLAYKQHYVVDLQRASREGLPSHHRRNVRFARRQDVEIVRCRDPLEHLDDWVRLYQVLTTRHDIRGLAAFSEDVFAMQLALPELVAYRAVADGVTVGMVLWIRGEKAAYYHLAAYDATGYDLKVSFALFDEAMKDFAEEVPWLGLGAAAGLQHCTGMDGLSRFKAGWANDLRQVYFCGRVGQPDAYLHLVGEAAKSPFFPEYRRH